ncbi:MAG: hypothetical protein ABI432_17860 [Flavobacteriales bacterium]
MSEQNKTTNVPPADSTKPGTQPSTNAGEGNAPKTPNHEQGREHTPNVEAHKAAADVRRTAEQAQVPTATADTTVKPNHSANDRQQNETGDARPITAEGQDDRKPGNDAVGSKGTTNTSGTR